MLGGRTVVRGAYTISSYLEGTGTNLRLTLNPPFTPGEINALYNGVALPATNSTDGIVGSAASASCDAPAYACYAGVFLRVWDPDVQPAIANQWNLTIQHQLRERYDPSNWICGAERYTLDGAVRLRAEGVASKFILRDPTLYRS